MTKQVDIQPAGCALAAPEGVTILDAALADGIAYPHGCRSGRCGSCRSRLVSGKVHLLEHSRFALSDDEKSQGLIRLPLRQGNTLGSRSQALPPATIQW